MAISFSPITPDPIDGEWRGTVTFSGTYSSGESLDSPMKKFKTIDMAWFENESGYSFWYDDTNKKIHAYQPNGTEVSGAFSGTVKFIFKGRHQ